MQHSEASPPNTITTSNVPKIGAGNSSNTSVAVTPLAAMHAAHTEKRTDLEITENASPKRPLATAHTDSLEDIDFLSNSSDVSSPSPLLPLGRSHNSLPSKLVNEIACNVTPIKDKTAPQSKHISRNSVEPHRTIRRQDAEEPLSNSSDESEASEPLTHAVGRAASATTFATTTVSDRPLTRASPTLGKDSDGTEVSGNARASVTNNSTQCAKMESHALPSDVPIPGALSSNFMQPALSVSDNTCYTRCAHTNDAKRLLSNSSEMDSDAETPLGSIHRETQAAQTRGLAATFKKASNKRSARVISVDDPLSNSSDVDSDEENPPGGFRSEMRVAQTSGIGAAPKETYEESTTAVSTAYFTSQKRDPQYENLNEPKVTCAEERPKSATSSAHILASDINPATTQPIPAPITDVHVLRFTTKSSTAATTKRPLPNALVQSSSPAAEQLFSVHPAVGSIPLPELDEWFPFGRGNTLTAADIVAQYTSDPSAQLPGDKATILNFLKRYETDHVRQLSTADNIVDYADHADVVHPSPSVWGWSHPNHNKHNRLYGPLDSVLSRSNGLFNQTHKALIDHANKFPGPDTLNASEPNRVAFINNMLRISNLHSLYKNLDKAIASYIASHTRSYNKQIHTQQLVDGSAENPTACQFLYEAAVAYTHANSEACHKCRDVDGPIPQLLSRTPDTRKSPLADPRPVEGILQRLADVNDKLATDRAQQAFQKMLAGVCDCFTDCLERDKLPLPPARHTTISACGPRGATNSATKLAYSNAQTTVAASASSLHQPKLDQGLVLAQIQGDPSTNTDRGLSCDLHHRAGPQANSAQSTIHAKAFRAAVTALAQGDETRIRSDSAAISSIGVEDEEENDANSRHVETLSPLPPASSSEEDRQPPASSSEEDDQSRG
ncbi:unnamed protein product [Amoebophrya sp. A25]|nr:unnamed protein product [Amoebophrya sp. A25]|eukprot:GSA25T00027551001.1